ncbi:hypothetical protein ACL02U_16255 [Streptomyces sp. MS06]|uniref:hypothetical protein n=1 Tax=Streptomyces sp. MS06 TaxID=3385974 RepID=UPI00399FC310
MPLWTPLPLSLAAVALLLPGPSAAPPRAAPLPACVAPSGARDFPIRTRITGGPGSYRAGGGYGTWYVQLTNTTAGACARIHPVVVLADGRRALRPEQARLEFYDGPRAHLVRFTETDEDELVGVFADAVGGRGATGDPGGADAGGGSAEPDRFRGFTVGPHRTVTVKVRLAFTADAVPNEVTANASAVQRDGDDGEWVGQSGAYRFTIRTGQGPGTDTGTGTGTDTDTGTDTGGDADTGTGTVPGTGKESAPGTSPGTAPSRTTGTAPTDPAATAEPAAPSLPAELAGTGLRSFHRALAATGAGLLLLGGAALLLVRWRRRSR